MCITKRNKYKFNWIGFGKSPLLPAKSTIFQMPKYMGLGNIEFNRADLFKFKVCFGFCVIGDQRVHVHLH